MNTNNLITMVIYIARVFLVVRMTSNLTHAFLAMIVTGVALDYIIKRFLPPETAVTTLDMVLVVLSMVVGIYLFYTKFGGLGVVGLLGSNFISSMISGFLP
jgi:hypothetical protein